MKYTVVFILMIIFNTLYAQPEPGDVYREYIWSNFLRVGGDLGYGGTYLYHGTNIDLVDVIKVELIIEKLQSHEGTYGLEIEINDKGWIEVPIPETIPKPQPAYLHHTYPVIPIPASHLNPGSNNKFRMKVNPNHGWDWPQNIIYGVHFRVYYDPSKKAHPTGQIVSPSSGAMIGTNVQLKASVSSSGSSIKHVQYLGKYEDVNHEGDGIYRQWHYHYKSGVLEHYLGKSSSSPYTVNWNTEWVPDQFHPIIIAARIVDNSGMIYFTEPVSGLKLSRTETSIALIKPYEVIVGFVTRKPDRKEKFYIRSDIDRILAAQMAWTSWSPGHAHGIFINGSKVMDSEGPLHKYYSHRVNIASMAVFKEQENLLTTGQTEAGHHGMEVQWPGIMFLLKADFSGLAQSAPLPADSVSFSVLTESKIQIKWIDRANNEKGFKLERKAESGSFETINTINWAERCVIIDTSFDLGVNYVYRVTAYNNFGESSSAELQVTTPTQTTFFDFRSQSQYMPEGNWRQNAGLYFDGNYKGVKGEYLFGALKPVLNRPFTSSYIGSAFSFQESSEIRQSIFIRPKAIKNRGIEAFKLGLNSIAGDELNLTDSDSSFIAISLNISDNENSYRMYSYNKTDAENYAIIDSSSAKTFFNQSYWYKLNITWQKLANDSIAYSAGLDEYNEIGVLLRKANILQLSGKVKNMAMSTDDSIFSSMAADYHGGVDGIDDFLVYKIGGEVVNINEPPVHSVPETFVLHQNFPNPFNPSTTIRFSLPQAGKVNLDIINILGQKVATLVGEHRISGTYSVNWNASVLSSGMYFYTLRIDGNMVGVKRMLFIK